VLVAGLLIAKANPRPKVLIAWNITAASLVVAFFIRELRNFIVLH